MLTIANHRHDQRGSGRNTLEGGTGNDLIEDAGKDAYGFDRDHEIHSTTSRAQPVKRGYGAITQRGS